MSFLAVFATRQGASSFEISLITAGPAVVNLLFSLLAGRWLEGRSLVGVTYKASIISRLGYIALIPVPLYLAGQGQVWAVILITLVMSVPATVFAIAFNALLADVVSPEWRAHVVGRRNALLALASTLSSLLSGYLLDSFLFPTNYQIVFGLGAVGALMSSFHLSRLRMPQEAPPRTGQLMQDHARPGDLRPPEAARWSVGLRFLARSGGKRLLRLDVLRGPFGLLMAAYFAFYTCLYLAVPIFPIYNVRVLNLTDGQISLGTALFYAVVLIASMQLGRVTQRFGNRRVLVFGGIIFTVYPLCLALAYDVRLFLVGSLLGGVAWAMAFGGLVNRLMERTPQDERPVYMAFHNLALNLGILGGSLSGTLLAEGLGLRPAMWTVAVLRFLAGLLLLLWA
jgi:MFS family permease